MCHRFPTLKFVSVESGVGWLPVFLEAADWQWQNGEVRQGASRVRAAAERVLPPPDLRLLLVRGHGLDLMLELFPDNLIWETDFPHPTCQHPGLSSGPAERPADYVGRALGRQTEALRRRVLHDNAAQLYGLGEASR